MKKVEGHVESMPGLTPGLSQESHLISRLSNSTLMGTIHFTWTRPSPQFKQESGKAQYQCLQSQFSEHRPLERSR